MSNTFSSLKKKKKSSAKDYESLADKLQKEESKNHQETDERSWYPAADKNGNRYAVIRFLPEKETELPWVKTYSHGFESAGGWYIEECPTTIGKDCPVCDDNSDLWKEGEGSKGQQTARARKRRQSWYSNIMVIEDSKNPENEGKVFLFKYGYMVHQKILKALQPPEGMGDEPCEVTDFWEGANFKLKIAKVDGRANYNDSIFCEPTPLLDGDDKALEEIYNQMYDLNEFIAEDRQKPYDELAKRFARVKSNKKSSSADELDAKVEKSATEKSVEKEIDSEALPADEIDATLDEFDSMFDD